MFLSFALNRPDVLPIHDLGVRVGLKNYHGLAEIPAPRDCSVLAGPWRPFRTVAMWYLWRGLDPGENAP
jgi:DNA-3-methyladenine glycosylase II